MFVQAADFYELEINFWTFVKIIIYCNYREYLSSCSQALPENAVPEALPPFSDRATEIALRGNAS